MFDADLLPVLPSTALYDAALNELRANLEANANGATKKRYSAIGW